MTPQYYLATTASLSLVAGLLSFQHTSRSSITIKLVSHHRIAAVVISDLTVVIDQLHL